MLGYLETIWKLSGNHPEIIRKPSGYHPDTIRKSSESCRNCFSVGFWEIIQNNCYFQAFTKLVHVPNAGAG
jgi:hypothetical protein